MRRSLLDLIRERDGEPVALTVWIEGNAVPFEPIGPGQVGTFIEDVRITGVLCAGDGEKWDHTTLTLSDVETQQAERLLLDAEETCCTFGMEV